MRQPATRERYDAVAIALHWIIALGIISLCVMGLSMTHLAMPLSLKFKLYQLHKSIGITVLLAVILRVLWRLTHRPPPLPYDMPRHEQLAAEGTHWLLYALMLGLPLTGWALVSVSVFNIPTVLYGIIPWPHLPVLADIADKAQAEPIAKFIHSKLGWLAIAVVMLHALAALRHHFVLHDNILRRMLPARNSKP